MSDESELHTGLVVRCLLGVLAQGAPAPEAPKRFGRTSPDGLVRLVLEPDGTIVIDHSCADAEDGIAHVETAIKAFYNPTNAKLIEQESPHVRR